MEHEVKLTRSITVLMTAKKYINDLPKLYEFIKANRSYFPEVNDEFLEKIKIGTPIVYTEDTDFKERIPTFVELNHENIKKNRAKKS